MGTFTKNPAIYFDENGKTQGKIEKSKRPQSALAPGGPTAL